MELVFVDGQLVIGLIGWLMSVAVVVIPGDPFLGAARQGQWPCLVRDPLFKLGVPAPRVKT